MEWEGEGNSYLCYPVLKSYNIPSSRYPDDAVYIDKPQTFFQQHYVKIIASSVFLLLLIAAIVYYIRILRKAYSRLSEAVEKAEQANQLKSAFLELIEKYGADGVRMGMMRWRKRSRLIN